MIIAGCDVGTLTTKAVIMRDESIASYDIIATEAKPDQASKNVIDKALFKAGLSFKEIDFCVGTGWGRKKIGFANKNTGELLCHGKGAQWLIPSVSTVIDVGAQTSSVIIVNKKGKVTDFETNDKCATGAGRFLGVIAEALELDINEIGPLSLRSNNIISISNQCVVFAESEVISYVNEGKDLADIVGSINHSIARRLVTLVKRIGIIEDICITGGVAKNIGVVKSIEEIIGVKIKKMPEDPQIIGALGAAIIAKEIAK